MIRFALAMLGLFIPVSLAGAWNDKGHMVVARLAWKELSAGERAKVLEFLAKHPHYEEYLKKDRPDNIPEEEWVFMRAATWADWVRGGPAERRKYNQPTWHYVNLPLVQAGSQVKPPPLPEQNIIKQITASKNIVKLGGSQEERAIHVCWLFHLLGDLHQPMHCITFYGDAFPDGDRGGNRALARIEGRRIQMHAFWDELLGAGVSRGSIDSAMAEIEALIKDNAAAIEADLKANQTPEDWAKEGFAQAKRWAYLNGELRPANADQKPANEMLPNLSVDYAKDAGKVARLGAAKAGKRLAGVLREVISAN